MFKCTLWNKESLLYQLFLFINIFLFLLLENSSFTTNVFYLHVNFTRHKKNAKNANKRIWRTIEIVFMLIQTFIQKMRLFLVPKPIRKFWRPPGSNCYKQPLEYWNKFFLSSVANIYLHSIIHTNKILTLVTAL